MELAKELRKKAKGVRVLYVEDDNMIRAEVAEFLKRFFENVDEAQDGQEGLQKFEAGKYDLVVTDVKMPKMNGLQMSKEIKKLKKNVKIVVTSAFDDKEILLKAIENDIDHYIVKPIDFSQFVIMLYKTIALIKLQKRIDKLNRHKQAILDFQDGIIFTVHKDRITSVNKKFLDFFQLKSLNELQEKQINIADAVIKEEPYFYPSDKNNWIDDIYRLSGSDIFIKMLDAKKKIPKVFIAKIGALEEFNEAIITLTDITDSISGAKLGESAAESGKLYAQENITGFFESLKEEIDRSRRHSQPISLVEILINADGQGEDNSNAIQESIVKELGIVDFAIRITDRKYFLAKVATDIKSARVCAINIKERLNKNSKKAYFGITALQFSDTIEEMLARTEKLTEKARQDNKDHIKSDPYPETDIAEEQALIHSKLSGAMEFKMPVAMTVFFNGIKVSGETSVVSCKQGKSVILQVGTKLLNALKYEKELFLSIPQLTRIVKAKTTGVAPEKKSVRLDNLSFVSTSAMNRKYLRITCRLPASIICENEDLSGEIVDVSVKSLSIEIPILRSLRLGKMVGVRFTIDTGTQKEEMSPRGEVFKIEKTKRAYRVVLLLSSDSRIEQSLIGYISKCELGIAHQLSDNR